MSDEFLDIYDASLRPLGQMEWSQAHKTGQWHRTFHCWVYRTDTSAPQILFQLRSPNVGNFPDLLDVSAAGHLVAGESTLDGIREVKEELGIEVGVDQIVYIGDRVEVADERASGDQNREYQSVHLLHLNLDLAEYAPQEEEVWGLFFVDVADGLSLFAGRTDEAMAHGIEFEASSGSYQPADRRITREDFLPRIQRYYMAALIAVERAAQGLDDLAIS